MRADRAELDVRDLALAVGQRGGDAVDVEAHAADAEGGACAEAAHRDLHVLRVVLAVAREHAGHGGERLGDVDLRARVAHLVAVDAVDRRRHVEGARLGARGGDDHRREPAGAGGGRADGLRRGGGGDGAAQRAERQAEAAVGPEGRVGAAARWLGGHAVSARGGGGACAGRRPDRGAPARRGGGPGVGAGAGSYTQSSGAGPGRRPRERPRSGLWCAPFRHGSPPSAPPVTCHRTPPASPTPPA